MTNCQKEKRVAVDAPYLISFLLAVLAKLSMQKIESQLVLAFSTCQKLPYMLRVRLEVT